MRPIDAPKFAYNGGKANLRRFIVRFFPCSGSHYVEPFAGRFNVFFLARVINEFQQWHLNDIRTKVFYDALQAYKNEEIPDIPPNTPISEVESQVSLVVFRLLEPLLCWAGSDYSKTKKAVPMPGRDFRNYKNTIVRAKDLLTNVTFTEIDAVNIVKWYGKNEHDAFLYIDPPYLNANVASYSSNDFDYIELMKALKSAKCRWLLSEYENDIANSWLGEPTQKFYSKVNIRKNEINISKDAVEVLYSNYNIENPRIIDFKESVRSPKSSRLVFYNGEKLTRSEVYSRWPAHWGKKNFPIEFNCLIKDPFVYWNGKIVQFLDGFER